MNHHHLLPDNYDEIRAEWLAYLKTGDNKSAEKCYFEKVMPAIFPVILARAESIPMYDGVISLLGFTPETVVLTSRILNPKKLVLLHTPETAKYIDVVRGYSKVPHTSFFQERFQHDESNIDDIYVALKHAIGKFKPSSRIAIELTGGKKTMGSQLAIAAGVLAQNSGHRIDVCYIDYDKYLPEFRKPEPETTRLLLIKNPLATPYKIFGNIKQESLDSREIIINPKVFFERNFAINERVTFVLMPFGEKWSDRIWKRVLKPIFTELKLEVMRADDLYGHDIMEDIWKGINEAELIVADITKRNPNVFYELGIAHTLGKSVILLTQNLEDIPFDLKRYRVIEYQDNLDGYESLDNGLRKMLSEIYNT